MVPNDFEPRHGALYATAAPNNTESRWATCPDVTMVNGYGEDNVLPHGRQFAIPWFLTSHPTTEVSFFLKSRGVPHNEARWIRAPDAQRRTLLRINVFFLCLSTVCGLPGSRFKCH